MTVPTTIDGRAWLGKYLEGADGDVDLAREMMKHFAEVLMSAEASAQCGAGYNERGSEERENYRNGYRSRRWDTRVGSIELAIPKLRQGVYSPEFLLMPRRRADCTTESAAMLSKPSSRKSAFGSIRVRCRMSVRTPMSADSVAVSGSVSSKSAQAAESIAAKAASSNLPLGVNGIPSTMTMRCGTM